MDSAPYLELSRKLFRKTGNFIMAVTQVPESKDFVLEFPYHHPQNSDKLDFLGLDLIINEGQKNTAWFDLKLWIDNSNIGKLYLYIKENSQSKFQEVFEIGTDVYEPLGMALSNLTPKNSAVRCGVYVRVFMDKDSGKLIAVDMALPYASDAAKIGTMFAENNL